MLLSCQDIAFGLGKPRIILGRNGIRNTRPLLQSLTQPRLAAAR